MQNKIKEGTKLFKNKKDLVISQIPELSSKIKSKIEKILDMNIDDKKFEEIVSKNQYIKEDYNVIDNIIDEIYAEDKFSEELDNFIENNNFKTIFSKKEIDKMTVEELEKTIHNIEVHIKNLEKGNESRIDIIKTRIFPIPSIKNFPEKIQKIIKNKLNDNESVFHSNGAENNNYGKINSEVFKQTMDRHNNDYFSILQLIKFMYSLERDYRKENERLEIYNIEVKIANEGFIFYEDEDGNYKRIIKQDYAEGVTIDKALKEELYKAQRQNLNKKYNKVIFNKDELEDIDPEDFINHMNETNSELFTAYYLFLQSTANISKRRGYLLDISDSRQGFKYNRGNILNTSNIFVKKDENGKYIFTIIDPDVFNKDGRAKFSTQEKTQAIIKEKGAGKIKAKIKAFMGIGLVNLARDGIANDNESEKEWGIYQGIKHLFPTISVAGKQIDYMQKLGIDI